MIIALTPKLEHRRAGMRDGPRNDAGVSSAITNRSLIADAPPQH
ncbi:MAG: hypothetical protein ABI593_16500 [Betaproteobacteria bacterium]